MFFSQKVIDDILKCSFCKAKFTGVIKLIPECGCSICGSCHICLREELNGLNEYVCKECNQWHTLPDEGLADNRALEKMLQMQSEAKPQSDKAFLVKTLMDDIQSRIQRLNNYDATEEVAAYCGHLERQVMEAVDTAFNHLNKVGNQLLEKINEYRSKILERTESRPFKRVKSSDLSVEQQLARLTAEFKEFSSASSQDFSLANDALFYSVQNSIRGFQNNLELIETGFMNQTFNGEFLKYTSNENFCKSTSHLGELLLEQPSDSNEKPKRTVMKWPPMADKVLHNLTRNSAKIRQVAFLFDGNLASSSDDRTIKVWNPQAGEMLYELQDKERIKDLSFSLVPLSERWLASSSGNMIYIWDLNERKIIKKLRGHQEIIFSMKLLGNNNLVSASFDGTIKIWNPNASKNPLMRTMRGHGISHRSSLGIMSNDQIVTCSNSELWEYQSVKIWDEAKFDCVDLIRTSLKRASCLVVLKNDRVAVGLGCGTIKIFDIKDRDQSVWLSNCHEKGVYSMLSSPDGHLLSTGFYSDPIIKVWNPNTGRLIKAILTGHANTISTMSISKDGRFLATGSFDGVVKIIYLGSGESKDSDLNSSF